MNNEFLDEFTSSRKNQPNSKMLIEFNQRRNYLDEGTYVGFVEGPDDRNFYSSIKSNDNLRNINHDNYIYSNNDSKENRGKKGVIVMYNYINNRFPYYLDKCVFIVDHDYNGLDNYDVSNKDAITVTKAYAFENYFLMGDNVRKIFHYLKIDDDYEHFMNKLKYFLYDVSEFVKLKSTITNNKFLHVNSLYSNNQIFTFDFSEKDYFKFDYMEKENENMLNVIKRNKGGYKYYKNKTDIFTNKVDWVRGHDIFNFLSAYLKYFHDKDISNEKVYNSIVKLLDVDIEVKDGEGTVLK